LERSIAQYITITIPGGYSEGVTPVPIPNTAVKPFSADGTWAYALGEYVVARIKSKVSIQFQDRDFAFY
jgi:hypothetical protein